MDISNFVNLFRQVLVNRQAGRVVQGAKTEINDLKAQKERLGRG
jgi:hypothetical protein